MTDDSPLYQSVEHCLNCAYYALIKVPYNTPCVQVGTGGTSGMTWDEVAGQAGMVFSEIRHHLTTDEISLVDAWKITPETFVLANRKIVAVRAVRDMVAQQVSFNKEYLLDVVSIYCDLPELTESDDTWATRLGVSTRTLRTIRNGNRTREGVNGILDNKVNTVKRRLGAVFRNNGWIR